MRINFIQQYRLIMEYGKRKKLSSHERLFYMALFYCANNIAMQGENQDWPEDFFPVSNLELNGWTGFDVRAIRNLRNSLKQRGLIDFKKGDGKKSDPEYRIFYLQSIGYKIAPDNKAIEGKNAPDNVTEGKNAPDKGITEDNFAHDTVPDSVPDHVPDSVVIEGKNAPDNGQSTYVYKNKKEKENKNININSSHERDRIESNLIFEESSDTMRSDSDATANTISKSIFQNYEKRIKANIGYDDLLIAHPLDIELIENLLDLIVEQMLSSSDETLIAGSKYPTEYVKRKLLKLDYTHMEYALECFKKNTTKVRNIKKYLLSILFNAPSTIEGYYNAEVHHDMPWLAK